jgi:hypothetical protein
MKKEIKTGDKYIDNLYKAVVDYIKNRGGSVVVIGGIALVQEDERKFNYGVMVRVTGKKPKIDVA